MAFYYEADAAVWKYTNQRERRWIKFDVKICRKLEKVWKKCQKGDWSNCVVEWPREQNGQIQTWEIGIKEMVAKQVSSVSYWPQTFEVTRDGHPYPKKAGSKRKLEKMFDQFAGKGNNTLKDPEYDEDEDEEEICSESNVIKFLEKCSCSPELIDSLILHAMCKCEELMVFGRQNFVEGLSSCGVDTYKGIRSRVTEIKNAMLNRNSGKKILKNFAEKAFRLAADDARQKNLPLKEDEQPGFVLSLFHMVFVNQMDAILPLGKYFLEFLRSGPVVEGAPHESISIDEFKMISEFLLTNSDHSLFDDAINSDWPLLIESFMEWYKKTDKAKAMDTN